MTGGEHAPGKRLCENAIVMGNIAALKNGGRRSQFVEVSDLDHPRGVKKSKKIPPKSGSRPAWFFLVLFGHPILARGFYDHQDTTHLQYDNSS